MVTTGILGGSALLAAPPVTQWPERLELTLGVFAIFALGALLMYRSWRRRARRQSDLLPLPDVPASPGEPVAASAGGLFVGTTVAGDWQARVVAGGLSSRARGALTAYPDVVTIDRQGTTTLAIPREAVRAVRTDRALAGKVLGPGGMLVVTWEHRGAVLDTGFAPDDRGQLDACLTALRAWVPAQNTHNTGNGGPLQ
ncbi:MAG: hypothetical protein QOC93_2727 [Actinomycetota bacterium]|nr:putative rane protein [Cryptosporangiaceae bacterium]MDQ1677583.1 hypothetical protein [Actinomycetota bacterium]